MDKKRMFLDTSGEAPSETNIPEAIVENAASQYHDEPRSALAAGLPSWSIEPPSVVVRRKVRAL
jgi:hypothetical protein